MSRNSALFLCKNNLTIYASGGLQPRALTEKFPGEDNGENKPEKYHY